MSYPYHMTRHAARSPNSEALARLKKLQEAVEDFLTHTDFGEDARKVLIEALQESYGDK